LETGWNQVFASGIIRRFSAFVRNSHVQFQKRDIIQTSGEPEGYKMVAIQKENAITLEEFWALAHESEGRYELLEGEIVEMAPTGDRHGVLSNWIGYLITRHIEAHDLGGDVTGAETGFVLCEEPRTVCAPDLAYVVEGRLMPMTGRYYAIPPDLAVEVVSPGDSAPQIRRKVDLYLEHGTLLVWVVYPDQRIIDVYRPGERPLTVKEGDTLSGEDVLPAFGVLASEVFKRLRD
jgi:Uma2 family endonuclease